MENRLGKDGLTNTHERKELLFPDKIDWQEYYSQCRESCHQYCQKTLTLVFQFTSFSVATLTITALLYEKVNKILAFIFSVVILLGLIYFLMMIIRYYHISRVSSQVCQDIENDYLFGKSMSKKYGVLNAVVTFDSGFFSSDRMLIIIKMYVGFLSFSSLLLSAALLKFCFNDIISMASSFFSVFFK